VNYSDYFNYQTWWEDAAYQLTHFFKQAGTTEMAVMAAIVMAVGLVCMRGFQIR